MESSNRTATCVHAGPLTVSETVLVVIVLVLAVTLAATGMPTLSVIVLIGEAMALGLRLVRRLRTGRQSDTGHARA